MVLRGIRFDMKIKHLIAAFLALEVADAALSSYGIYIGGAYFEKNLFLRAILENYGLGFVVFSKLLSSIVIAASLFWLSEKYKRRRILTAVSYLLVLIALYGVFTVVYALFLYP